MLTFPLGWQRRSKTDVTAYDIRRPKLLASVFETRYDCCIADRLSRFSTRVIECRLRTNKALTSRVFEPKVKAFVQEARQKRDGG